MDLSIPTSINVIGGAEALKYIAADRSACVDLVSRAYLVHDSGDSSLPHSSFLRIPRRERDRIIALPAYLGGEFDVAGIKWIASWPENTARGLARASAVLVLNDPATGFPFTCLEASVISATRTAASAVLGAEALIGGRTARRIGFIGTGLIAGHVADFLADLAWETDGYRLFDLSRPAAERFATRLTERGAADVQVVDEVAGVFAQCDLVVLATVAGTPHLHDPELLANRPVVLHLSLRDLDPALVLSAQNITDDVDHVMREHTSLHLAEQQAGHRDFVEGTIADIVAGRIRRDPERAAVYSPFGLGVLDLAIGQWVHRQATEAGEGRLVSDFFPAAQ
ncbi:2,3-diaminopropionate biosynthesis protein SbnB [Streptomyces sp. CB01881]|uniref:2,3-diaminopropionate biosynthesis protein SbnB n=1 Tax=Streptomyces sp. CB01881 TaxID=2078691 RepID=UPI000CDC9CA5|nr:2,3-diaminopropionate biosynthesis protein SbnB [Streptomyces sp. CB01881]AUY52517.1 2,3-diaminopropionate biosynthesis protein SbnB [Streptomyces sp. CB01881]TYC70234.1 2,3-diaminopropionate biosynthesis protein SbnB [Streptomyces sp. CB01881]